MPITSESVRRKPALVDAFFPFDRTPLTVPLAASYTWLMPGLLPHSRIESASLHILEASCVVCWRGEEH